MSVRPGFSRKRLGKLGIIFGYKCNFSCAHCLSLRERSPAVTDKELNAIAAAIDRCRARDIHFTGGEPTLYLKEIRSLFGRVRANKEAATRITTNGHFAVTKEAALKLLSSIPRLKYVQQSYDKFHAEFLPFGNLRNLFSACGELGVKYSCNLTIQSPLDLALLTKLRGVGKFPVMLQRVSPMGEAKKNNLGYVFPEFNKKLLSCRCPNLNKLVYSAGRGFSICCSSLLFNGRYPWIFGKSPDAYFKGGFYKFMAANTFRSIAGKFGVPVSELLPEHSSPCALCAKLFVSRFGQPGPSSFHAGPGRPGRA